MIAKRAKKIDTPVAVIRRWWVNEKDSGLFLLEVKSKFDLPTRYLVVRRHASGNETIVSRHRRRSAATKKAMSL